MSNKKEFLSKINHFIETFDIEEVKGKKELAAEKQGELDNILMELSNQEFKQKNQIKKAELLKEVPCGSEYSHCKFIKDAYAAVDLLELTKSACSQII